VALIINIAFIPFGLLCMAGAVFGKGRKGDISSRLRRVLLFLAGLLMVVSAILRLRSN